MIRVAFWIERQRMCVPHAPTSPDGSCRYDKGAPDYMTGEKKNLKWRIVCQGVEALIAAKGLRTGGRDALVGLAVDLPGR